MCGGEPTLMDVQMPVMNGLDATRAIRQVHRRRGRHTPIVAMPAHTMRGDRERCLDAGMDDCVSKAVAASDLRRAIAPVTAQKAQ